MGNRLLFNYEGVSYSRIINTPFSQVEFDGYEWLDPHYRENVQGVLVLIDGVSHLLTRDFYYSREYILENVLSETYDFDLLQTIHKIVGEKEIEYDPDDCYGYNSQGEITLKSQLVEITTKHARAIAVLKTQPSILNLVEEIDKLKKELANSKEETYRVKQDLCIANNIISKHEETLKIIPLLEVQTRELLLEREMFKETILQRVRNALS